MDTNLDPSIRLAALQAAIVPGYPTHEIVGRAREFYAFLTGALFDEPTPERPASEPTLPTIDPLPLDGLPAIPAGQEFQDGRDHSHDLVPTADAVEAAKRKRRTKTEMEAAREADAKAYRDEKAQANAIEVAVEATAATPAPVAAVPEVADVKAALMKVVEKDGLGPTAGGKLLAQFGVKRVSELDAKTFADFIAACNAAVAA